ncbi:MAG: S4 domain-containing protein [Deltaproteobacteria bacterium]|nr:S4 domain-containing protein [Deltaproteobacteria bacterium]
MKITAQKDGPIVDLMVEVFGSASKTRIRKMLKHGMVSVGDQPVTRADFAVHAGDVIEYVKKRGRNKEAAPPVPIIFERLLTFGERVWRKCR